MTISLTKVKFVPQTVCATPAVIDKMDQNYAVAALCRHLRGDWGLVDAEDWDANDKALAHGGRLMSVFPLPDEAGDFWIITDGGHEVTTILLPEDY